MIKHIVFCLALWIGPISASCAQETLGPKEDQSGKGAVICLYDIVSSVQATAKACGWRRTPTDDEIDKALIEIETFIRANSSTAGPIQTMESIKRRKETTPLPADMRGQCTQFGLTDPTSSMNFVWHIHIQDAAKFNAGIADALSVPREPLMNPCL